MPNNFENLKNTLINFLSTREKTSKTKRLHKDLEESSILLDYNDKVQMKYSGDKNSKKYSLAIVTSARRIPFLYGLLGLLLLAVMIILSFYKKFDAEESKSFYVEAGKSKIKFLNFFKLPSVNKIVYHLINSSYSLVGIALLTSLFHVLNIKYANKGASIMQFFKLCLAISFGLMAQIINLAYGIFYLSGGIDLINDNFMTEMKISIFQFIFLIQIFFSVMFGIFTTIFISKLQTKPAYSLEDQEQTNAKDESNQYKWFNYKIIAVFYLAFFSLAYVFVYLHYNDFILQNFSSVYLKENYSYLLALFPYVLFVNNMILYLMFYDELKESSFYISHTAEEAEQYEKRERNIL